MLLSSAKFGEKADELLREELESKPRHVKLDKLMSAEDYEKVTLEEIDESAGGMMLYTSGTTAKPVSFHDHSWTYIYLQ